MKLLETVLNFLLTLAQVIFPRKRKPSPNDRPCPSPLPRPPLPLEGGNGSDLSLHRRDSLPPEEQPADWLGISGYTLIVCSRVGSICKWLLDAYK